MPNKRKQLLLRTSALKRFRCTLTHSASSSMVLLWNHVHTILSKVYVTDKNTAASPSLKVKRYLYWRAFSFFLPNVKMSLNFGEKLLRTLFGTKVKGLNNKFICYQCVWYVLTVWRCGNIIESTTERCTIIAFLSVHESYVTFEMQHNNSHG